MEVWNEPAVLFEKSTMFTKSRFCKIYKVTSENPSGYLPHSHDYMQIWYITRGCCEHWVEGQKHLMARGRYPSSFLRRSSIRWCGWKMPRSSAANFLSTIFSRRRRTAPISRCMSGSESFFACCSSRMPMTPFPVFASA